MSLISKDLRMVGIGLVISPVLFMVYEVLQKVQHLHLENQVLLNSNLLVIATKMWAVVPTMLIGVLIIFYFDKKIKKDEKKTVQTSHEEAVKNHVIYFQIENTRLRLFELKLSLIVNRQEINKNTLLKNDYESIISKITLEIEEIDKELKKETKPLVNSSNMKNNSKRMWYFWLVVSGLILISLGIKYPQILDFLADSVVVIVILVITLSSATKQKNELMEELQKIKGQIEGLEKK